MAFRDAVSIFKSLRNGTVPLRGLEAFAVGIDGPRKELARKLAEVQRGEGDVKFLRGGYGCGKTFMARMLVAEAQQQGFVTSFVVVSDNDFHLHKFDDLYRKVVGGLSTPRCEQGALGDLLDRWIGRVEDALVKTGTPESDPAFDEKVKAKLDEQLASAGGNVPDDMKRVVRRIFELKQAGQLQDASTLISWLSGSENIAASAKRLAQLKGEIESTSALAYLRGVLEIVRSADSAPVVARLGWSEPAPGAGAGGRGALDGHNAVVLAPTAGGKTEASMFPTLSLLMDAPPRGWARSTSRRSRRCSTTRPSASALHRDGRPAPLRVARRHRQPRAAQRVPAEPGRAADDHARVARGDAGVAEDRVDERSCSRPAHGGHRRGPRAGRHRPRRAPDERARAPRARSAARRAARRPERDGRQPRAILKWLQGQLEAVRASVVDPPKQPAAPAARWPARPSSADLAHEAARTARGQKSLFFCQSRALTEAVAEHMRGRDRRVRAPQRSSRSRSARSPRSASPTARRLHRLHLDARARHRRRRPRPRAPAEAPDTVSSFLQRMGRTGRAGQVANTTFFCETGDGVVQAIALIELAKAGWVEPVELSDRCWPVLVHQLLAMSLAENGVPPEEAWAHLSRVPDFKGITAPSSSA
jgi:hypothetical protein